MLDALGLLLLPVMAAARLIAWMYPATPAPSPESAMSARQRRRLRVRERLARERPHLPLAPGPGAPLFEGNDGRAPSSNRER